MRHAEHDGQRGQGGAQLARRHAAEGDLRLLHAATTSSAHDRRPSSRWIRAVGRGGRVVVVRDHHGRLPERVGGVAQEREHLVAGLRVEVAGRLVGEEDGRLGDERARDGDALLLAAGELRRAVRRAVGEADALDDGVVPGAVDLAAGELERQEDVLLCRQRRQQVEGLEDEADVRATQLGQLRVVHLRDVLAGDVDGAGRRLVKTGEHVHERRLAGARGAHDRGELAARDVERDAAKGVDSRLARAVAARDVVGGDCDGDRTGGGSVIEQRGARGRGLQHGEWVLSDVAD